MAVVSAGDPYCDHCLIETLLGPGVDSVLDSARRGTTRSSYAIPAEVLEAPEESEFGRYVAVESLGEGAMGEVWRAWDRELARWVALKLLKRDDPSLISRFVRESRLAGRLSHPRIAQIYEAGEARGRHFIAMQLVEGQTLEELLGGDPGRIARLIRDAAGAVAHAHGHGVIHRDIKPANVMVEPARDGESEAVYVMDFGLARGQDGQATISIPGEVLGTPAFMSPEQIRGERVDHRADVYSLGATLYTALTGHLPFPGTQFSELYKNVVSSDPVPPRRLRPELPGDLETISLRCLEKEPGRRYASCSELAADLDRFLAGEPILARPPSLTYLATKYLRRNKRVVVATAATLLASLAAYVAFVYVPQQRILEADRAALRAQLEEKVNLERAFNEQLSRRDHDAAIATARAAFSRRPPQVELAVPAVADEEEFAPLREEYAVSLPRALRLRGSARLEARDSRGKGDLANAYRTGRDHPASRDEAREALLELAEQLFEEGRFADAEATARIVAGRFGSEHVRTRAILARAFQRTGRLEDALAVWVGLQDDPQLAGEAQRECALLRQFLPRRRVPLPPRQRLWLGDLDGDGGLDVLALDAAWRLRRLRLGATGWSTMAELQLPPCSLASWGLYVLDVDGDGAPEVFVTSVNPKEAGQLVAVSVRDGGLHLTGVAPLMGRPMGARAIDVDGDGRNELAVWLEWPKPLLEVYTYGRDALRHRFRWSTLAQVRGVEQLGPGRLLVMLAHWTKTVPGKPVYAVDRSEPVYEGEEAREWGYRAIVLERGADGRYRESAASPDRFHLTKLVRRDATSFYVESEWKATVQRVVPGGFVGAGLLRVEGSGLSAVSRLAVDGTVGDRIDLEGRPARLVLDDSERVHVLDDETGAALSALGEAAHRLAPGTDPPIFYRWVGQEVELFGLGEELPIAAPQLGALRREVGAVGELSPGQELIEIGLYEQAAQVLRATLAEGGDAQVHYDLGLALDNLGSHAEAAESFGRAAADRRLVVNALLRQAKCLELVGDWEKLRACIEALAGHAGAGTLARDYAQPRRGWVRTAGIYQHTAVYTDWAAASTPLLVEDPTKVRVGDEGLRTWTTSDFPPAGAGVLVPYDGGSLRARVRFVPVTLEWDSSAALGAAHASDPVSRAWVAYKWSTHGATSVPITTDDVQLGVRSLATRREYVGGFELEAGAEYLLEIEYVGGFSRAFFTLRRAGAPLLDRKTLTLPVTLSSGAYLVGRPRSGSWRPGDGEYACEVRLISVEVDSAAASKAPAPKSAWGWLLRANGLLVQARTAEALAAYERALETEDVALRARALLFRALCHLRAGSQAEAQADVRAGAAADRAVVSSLLQGTRARGLTAAEVAFLRGAAR